MKKNVLYLISFLIIALSFTNIQRNIFNYFNNKELEREEEEQKIPLQDRMDLAWQQEAEMTADPESGLVPRERLLEAFKYKQSLLKQKGFGKAAITGINWNERGPNNVGGRTRAICIDLNDVTYKTVWAGGVAGGLWKTTDITVANPTWTPTNDFFDNLAITYIEQSTTNPQVMYFCTGEGNNNIDAVRGLGVWKSTNGGSTWSQLASTNNSNFYYCQKVFCPSGPDTVFVASQTGLYRSVNGGTSFTKVLGSGISSAGGNIAYDIERAANGTLYASMSSGGSNSGTIHKSFNNGTTWQTPMPWTTAMNKREVEIALSNNDTNTIWGLVENGGTIIGIVKSTSSAGNFTVTSAYPDDADGGIPSTDFSRGQAWYDLSIAVDPNNSNVCVVGGIDLFKTSNGGTSWQQITHWYGGFGFQEVHADQHYAQFSPGSSSICYFTNDGGIYRSTNFTNAIPTITSKESNYNTSQFYGCDVHPTLPNYFLMGAQDNGSHRLNAAGISSSVEVSGGDGVFCHIDQNQPAFQFTSYVYNNYFRSNNSGSSFSSVVSSNSGRFVNPSDYDDSLNIMYAADASGSYFRWSNPQTGSTTNTVSLSNSNGQVTAVKVSPNVAGRVYFGFTGRVVRVDGANTGTTQTGTIITTGIPAGGYISSIEVELGNEKNILITMSNYGVNSVWQTKNSGTTWTSVEGNLPDMPIRWIVFHPQNPNMALVATELGVWSTDSLNGTSTNWAPSNSGLANVRVDMLKVQRAGNMVAAATHGRGLYTCILPQITNTTPTANFIADKTITYPASPIQFTSTSSNATSYLWTFGDGTTSTLANPIKSYSIGGIYTVSLSINSGVSINTKTNFISVLPQKGIPYTLANGGDFETNSNDFIPVTVAGSGFARGNSTQPNKNGTRSGSFAWVTDINSANYADNSVSYLYSPSYNFTASGTYSLSFYMKNIFEVGYDGIIVEYSINSGNTWQPLGSNVGTNWYDFANTTTTDAAFPFGQAFFNAGTLSYTLRQFNVSFLSGNNNVAFRLVFKSDINTNTAGAAIDDWSISGPVNISLPVSLLSFSGAKIDARNVGLTWITSNESNNTGFYIERRSNWADEWKTIAFVKGKGNSTIATHYKHTDVLTENFGTLFYRLKQQDFDGSVSYSKAIKVNNEGSKQLIGAVIPDATGKIFTVLQNELGGLGYSISNIKGQVLMANQYLSNQTIDCSHLQTGIYFFSFKDENGTTDVRKVFVY
jgi:PKD repeat protein